MRAAIRVLTGLVLAAAACVPPPPVTALPQAEIEIALDEGRAAEMPLTPPLTFETLMRIDPHVAAYRLSSLRMLLAQPGHVVLRFYAIDDVGHPGALLTELDRVYGPEMTSSGSDGKWVVEHIDVAAVQHAPVFVGLSSPEKHGDPRLWASSNNTGEVFQRDADPSVALEHLRIPRTPKLRVTVLPQ